MAQRTSVERSHGRKFSLTKALKRRESAFALTLGLVALGLIKSFSPSQMKVHMDPPVSTRSHSKESDKAGGLNLQPLSSEFLEKPSNARARRNESITTPGTSNTLSAGTEAALVHEDANAAHAITSFLGLGVSTTADATSTVNAHGVPSARAPLLSASAAASSVRCMLRGAPVSHSTSADCHGRPPFWAWWRDYRNCIVTNVCLHQGNLTLYSGDAPTSSLNVDVSGPLACNHWNGPSYRVIVRSGSPPGSADSLDPRGLEQLVWHDAGLHASRLLPGHFGHDILNNYLFMFNTLWEFGLVDELERASMVWFDPASGVSGTAGDAFMRVQEYSPLVATVWNERHCFRTAMLSLAHTHSAELVFRRSSPSRSKRAMWFGFRDAWLRRFCPECGRVLAAAPLTPRPSCPPPEQVQITLLYRTTVAKSSNVLFANGRGRRIVNQQELAQALSALGRVVQRDPASLSLRAQHELMLETRVLVARMSSTVVGAMFMRPGGVCVEIEGPDPSAQYYDHPSTLEEISEIFHHSFFRSMDSDDGRADLPLQAVVGDVHECQELCAGPERLRSFAHAPTVAQCSRRCARLGDRIDALKKAADSYLRPHWFQNWWLADTYADIPHVVDLVSQGLGCFPNSRVLTTDSAPPEVAAHTQVYVPSSLELSWQTNIEVWQGNESVLPDWPEGCAALASQSINVSKWLEWNKLYERTKRASVAERDAVRRRAPIELSRWRPEAKGSVQQGRAVADAAHADGMLAERLIEPLVGHLRHPRFHCLGDDRDTLSLMFSTEHFVLPFADELRLPRGARALLFDLGASVYDRCGMGCQKWLVETYSAHGIEFDRILAWEAAAVNHTELWRSIPGHLKPRFQYFNTAASADPASSDNPLNHILAIARQEDYVVLKLDIDHPELELAIIDQILVSPQLCAIIDELFWEHHVRRSPLQQTRVAFMGKSGIGWGEHVPARGQVAGTLASSHQIFASLRREGIRAHSWI